MSSVDNRVVQMEFDNKRFESNVKTTMSTLDKLKQKLSFGKETKELEELQNAGDNFSMSHMANAIDKIGDKFSMLGVLGMTAMNKIASAAVDAGTRLIKSLSIDQITAGFDKYTEETNSVQAIYSAVKPKGKTLNQVYDTLEKLAKYTDETSYNYTVMTGTMANFIGKGLEMERSERILEGIANAAATAGVGIQDANIIFRNWADAISKGELQLIDWKSMQSKHMDTEAFITELINMAKEVGTVDKATGKLSKTMTKVGKAAADEVVTINNFEELLRYGFINTEVIARTFEKYADQTTEFGLDAYHAAQQARTFVDVIGALKDAASSNWSTTFRLVFGDLEEATDLFSTMADSLLVVVGDIGKARNLLVKGWRRLGGRDTLLEGLTFWWESFEGIRATISKGLKDAFGIKDMPFILKPGETYIGDRPEDVLDPGILMKWSEAFRNAGNELSSWLDEATTVEDETIGHAESLTNIFKGLFSTSHIVFKFFEGIRTFTSNIRKQLGPTFDRLIFYFGKIGEWVSNLNHYITENNVFGKLAERISNIFEPITRRLPGAITKIAKLFGEVKNFVKTNPKIQKTWKSLKNLFDGILDSMPTFVNGAIEFAKAAINFVKNSDEWKWVEKNFNLYIRPVVSKVVEFTGAVADALTKFFKMDTSGITSWWDKVKARFSAFNELGPLLNSYWEAAKKKFPFLKKLEEIWNTNPVIQEIKKFVTAIGHAVYRFFNQDVIDPEYSNSIFGQLKVRFEAAWNTFKIEYLDPTLEEIKGYFAQKYAELKEKMPFIQAVEDFFVGIFGKKDDAEKTGNTVGDTLSRFFRPIFEKIKEWLSKLTPKKILKLAKTFTALQVLYTVIRTFKNTVSLFESVADTVWQAYATLRGYKVEAWSRTFLNFAVSAGILALALKLLGGMEWDEIGKGLTAMGGLFLEEGAFIVLVSRLTAAGKKTKGSALNFGSLIGTAGSIWILGNTVKKLADMDFWAMEQGLLGVAELFGAEGAFMVLVRNLTNASKGSTTDIQSGGLFKGFSIIKKKFSGKDPLGFMSLIGVATSIYELASAVQKLGEMDFWAMEQGFLGVAELFGAEGAFMVLVRNLTKANDLTAKDPLNIGSLLGTAISIKILTGSVSELANLDFWAMEQGLLGVAELFGAEGAFMVLVRNLTKASSGSATDIQSGGLFKGFSIIKNKFSGKDPLGLTTLIGTATSIKILADAVVEIGTITTPDAIQGLVGVSTLLFGEGMFITLVRKFNDTGAVFDKNPLATGTLLATAGSIKILADAVVEIGAITTPDAVQGLLGVYALLFGEGAFMVLVRKLADPSAIPTKDPLSSGVLLSIAVNMKILGDELVKLGSLGWEGVLPGMAAMGSLFVGDGAMVVLLGFLNSKDMLNLGGTLKGAAALVIIAAAVGAAVSILMKFTGDAIADLSDKIAIVGANLQQFSESTSGIDTENSKSKLNDLKDMSVTLAEIGLKDYGNLGDFRNQFVHLGAQMMLFHNMTKDFDGEAGKKAVGDLVSMSDSLASITDAGDKSQAIANIGGALKLFSDDTAGATFTTPPDVSQLTSFFESLSGLTINGDTVSEIGSYADGDKAAGFNSFAIGLTNIATSVETFSKTAQTLDFGDMEHTISILTAITELNTGLTTVEITKIGPFAKEVKTQTKDMGTFAEDIVLLGESLAAFGTSIGSDDIDLGKMDRASEVLKKISEIGNSLEAEGGLKQWFTGTKSLTRFSAHLRILGGGAAAFADSISTGSFDTSKINAASNALLKIIEVNNSLPPTGGIKQWFTGQANVDEFTKDLPGIGTALAGYLDAIGGKTFSESSLDAFKIIERLMDVQERMDSAAVGNGFIMTDQVSDFAAKLPDIATAIVSYNDKLTGVKWSIGDANIINEILSSAVDMQVKLSNTEKAKSLGNLGSDLKAFFDKIKGVKAANFTDISTILTDIFDALSKPNTIDFEDAGQSMIVAIAKGVTDNGSQLSNVAIISVCNAAVSSADSYYNDFYNVGFNYSAGLAEGMSNNSSAVSQAAASVVSKALDAARAEAQQNSPWKTTQEMGKYFDYGLADGMNNYRGVVEASSKDIVTDSLNPVLEQLKMVASLPFDELDLRPTIRPVLDTSDLTAGAQGIGRMFDDQRVRIRGLDTRAMENYAASLGNLDRKDSVPGIMQSINDINGRLDNLGQSIRSMRVVLNSGKVVGGIEDEMDKALGMRMIMSERGNS